MLEEPDEPARSVGRSARRLPRLPRGVATRSPTAPRSASSSRATRQGAAARRAGSDLAAWPRRIRRATRGTSSPASTGPTCSTPAYPYGEGVALQVRSAVSHLNEVWAVETAGLILHELSPELGWEFTRDAARWLYDETRHMLMGARRLGGVGLRTGADPARRLHLRGLRGPGPDLPARHARLLRDEEHRPQA